MVAGSGWRSRSQKRGSNLAADHGVPFASLWAADAQLGLSGHQNELSNALVPSVGRVRRLSRSALSSPVTPLTAACVPPPPGRAPARLCYVANRLQRLDLSLLAHFCETLTVARMVNGSGWPTNGTVSLYIVWSRCPTIGRFGAAEHQPGASISFPAPPGLHLMQKFYRCLLPLPPRRHLGLYYIIIYADPCAFPAKVYNGAHAHAPTVYMIFNFDL